MIPSWKGSDAEAARTKTLARVNIKFSHVAEGGRHRAIGAEEYTLEDAGFPLAGENMNGLQLAKYKYQIDLEVEGVQPGVELIARPCPDFYFIM